MLHSFLLWARKHLNCEFGLELDFYLATGQATDLKSLLEHPMHLVLSQVIALYQIGIARTLHHFHFLLAASSQVNSCRDSLSHVCLKLQTFHSSTVICSRKNRKYIRAACLWHDDFK